MTTDGRGSDSFVGFKQRQSIGEYSQCVDALRRCLPRVSLVRLNRDETTTADQEGVGNSLFINFTLVKPCNFVYVYTVMTAGNLNRRDALDSFV